MSNHEKTSAGIPWKRWWKYWWDSAEPSRQFFGRCSLILATFGFLGGLLFHDNSSRESVASVISWGLMIVGGIAAIHTFIIKPFSRHAALEDRLESRFVIECGPEVDGSRPEAGAFVYSDGSAQPKTCLAQFLRIRMTAEKESGLIKGAFVTLTKIEKAGQTRALWVGETEELTFVPGDHAGALRRDIADGVPVCADVLAITDFGFLFMGPLGRIWRYSHSPLEKLFSEKDVNYVLSVSVSGERTKSAHARLQFYWTGNFKTSTLTKLPFP